MWTDVVLVLTCAVSVSPRGSPWDWQNSNANYPVPVTRHKEASRPTFVRMQQNVSALLGSTAVLPCALINLRHYTVSWMRSRDMSVLSVGRLTFSTDFRFVVHKVNTDPKLNQKVYLYVKGDALVSISGPKLVNIYPGSLINLECVVRNMMVRPLWAKEGRLLSARVRLYILRAVVEDSGNYSCVLSEQLVRGPAEEPVRGRAEVGLTGRPVEGKDIATVAVIVSHGSEAAFPLASNRSERARYSAAVFLSLLCMAATNRANNSF